MCLSDGVGDNLLQGTPKPDKQEVMVPEKR